MENNTFYNSSLAEIRCTTRMIVQTVNRNSPKCDKQFNSGRNNRGGPPATLRCVPILFYCDVL